MIYDYFEHRYGSGMHPWIKGGTHALLDTNWTDGPLQFGKAVRFWAEVRQRAIELYQQDVTPGLDYALTEVVHCKSRDEARGVRGAAKECSDRYLLPILERSPARVVLVLGDIAAEHVSRVFGIRSDMPPELVRVADVDRAFAFLPHPNSRRKRRLEHCLTEQKLARLRNLLST